MSDFPREDLRRRLEDLARSEPPTDLSHGAMCYEMTGPPEVAEYLCPVCGQKTMYALGAKAKPKGLWNRLGQLLEPRQEAEADVRPTATDADNSRILPRDKAGEDVPGLVEYGLPQFRRQLAECGARELGITLDESEFCEHCRPGVTVPKLGLVVRNQDREHRVVGIDGTDVQLIAEFIEGKRKHVGEMGRETPLKEHARRLAELLGMDWPGGGG